MASRRPASDVDRYEPPRYLWTFLVDDEPCVVPHSDSVDVQTNFCSSSRELKNSFNLFEYDIALLIDQWKTGSEGTPRKTVFRCVNDAHNSDMPYKSLAHFHNILFSPCYRPNTSQATILSLSGNFKYDEPAKERSMKFLAGTPAHTKWDLELLHISDRNMLSHIKTLPDVKVRLSLHKSIQVVQPRPSLEDGSTMVFALDFWRVDKVRKAKHSSDIHLVKAVKLRIHGTTSLNAEWLTRKVVPVPDPEDPRLSETNEPHFVAVLGKAIDDIINDTAQDAWYHEVILHRELSHVLPKIFCGACIDWLDVGCELNPGQMYNCVDGPLAT